MSDISRFDVLSINVGKPREVEYKGKIITTGIWKEAIEQPIMLSSTKLAGDGQADLKHHGGVDKAVMVYSYDHYDYWEQQMNRKLEYGAFGENVTVAGLTEREVCIGDTFQWGDAVIQVSQPRYPCYKLELRLGFSEVVQLVLTTGFSGYYVRVLQTGLVSREAGLHRLQRHPHQMSVAAVSEAYINKNTPVEIIQSILAVDALSQDWRSKFESRLLGLM